MENNKEVKLFIKEGNRVSIDKDIDFEITNLEEVLSNFKSLRNMVPTPKRIFEIEYKIINKGKEYKGKTIFSTHSGLTHEFDSNSEVRAIVTNWHLGEDNSNPDFIIKIY